MAGLSPKRTTEFGVFIFGSYTIELRGAIDGSRNFFDRSMKFLRLLSFIILFVLIAVPVAIYGLTYFQFWSMDRLAASVVLGDTKREIKSEVLEGWRSEEVPMATYRHRFLDEVFEKLASDGSKMHLYYQRKEDRAPFFVLVFDPNEILIHKFVPGI